MVGIDWPSHLWIVFTYPVSCRIFSWGVSSQNRRRYDREGMGYLLMAIPNERVLNINLRRSACCKRETTNRSRCKCHCMTALAIIYLYLYLYLFSSVLINYTPQISFVKKVRGRGRAGVPRTTELRSSRWSSCHPMSLRRLKQMIPESASNLRTPSATRGSKCTSLASGRAPHLLVIIAIVIYLRLIQGYSILRRDSQRACAS